MKLCKDTIDIMRCLSDIAPGIHILPGNVITVGYDPKASSSSFSNNNIWAQAEIAETIPVEFACNNFGKFVSALTKFEGINGHKISDFNYEFGERKIDIITDDGSLKTSYGYTDLSIAGGVPRTMKYSEDSVIGHFVLTSAMLRDAMRLANEYDSVALEYSEDREGVFLNMFNKKYPNNDPTSMRLASEFETTKNTIYIHFAKECLRLIPNFFDYDVRIVSNGVRTMIAFEAQYPTVRAFKLNIVGIVEAKIE